MAVGRNWPRLRHWKPMTRPLVSAVAYKGAQRTLELEWK